MRVWLMTAAEQSPTATDRPRLMRTGLLTTALATAGHEATWWCSAFNHRTKTHYVDRTTAQTVTTADGSYRLIMLAARGYHRNVSLARILSHRDAAAEFTRLAATETPPDVIVCSMPTIEFARAATEYGQAAGVPVIVDIRDLWPDLFSGSLTPVVRPVVWPVIEWMNRDLKQALRSATAITGITPEFVRWATEKVEREPTDLDQAFPLAARIETPSEADRAAARDWWEAQGLDFTDPRPMASLVGSINKRLEIPTVIEAARKLPSWRFTLCGIGDSLDACRRMAADLPNVLMPGFIDQPKMLTLLEASTVGLLPYPTDINFSRNMPNKVAEYCAVGLPIVTSLGGVMERFVTDEGVGLRYPNGDADGLATLLTTLTRRPRSLDAMRTACRRVYHARFQTDEVLGRMVAHVQRIADGGRNVSPSPRTPQQELKSDASLADRDRWSSRRVA